MKRVFAILLILSITANICACGQSGEQSKDPDSILIAEYNVNQYLNVKVSPYIENRTRRAKVEIYPTRPGNFANTKISLKLTTDKVCTIYEIVGEKYEEFNKGTNDEYFVVEITLPVNGTYEFDVGFSCWFDTTQPIKRWDFHRANGKFYPQ